MDKIRLFRKTDTTLVYIASDEFAQEIMKEKYHSGVKLYIHIKRSTGAVIGYYNNDVNKVVHLDIVEQEYILQCADAER